MVSIKSIITGILLLASTANAKPKASASHILVKDKAKCRWAFFFSLLFAPYFLCVHMYMYHDSRFMIIINHLLWPFSFSFSFYYLEILKKKLKAVLISRWWQKNILRAPVAKEVEIWALSHQVRWSRHLTTSFLQRLWERFTAASKHSLATI